MSASPASNKGKEEAATKGKGQPFDLLLVTKHFEEAPLKDEDVDLTKYCAAYEELNKMFPLLGRVFSFVQSDVSDKLRILKEFLKGPNKAEYRTVKTMMEFEIKQDTTACLEPPSGSRTLLRLHRALEFVSELIRLIQESKPEDKMAPVARQAYDTTLIKFHPWVVQKGVHVACYALPHRRQLIETIAGKVPEKEANDALKAAYEKSWETYMKVQKLYVDKKLSDLP